MGSVFAARDTSLDRVVALKVLRPSLADEEHQGRLIREAQAMARVPHPNVVTVFDVGVSSDLLFIAMEYVEGTTLRDWLRCEPGPTAKEVLDMFLQAGAGLEAAHAAGIVHRDFKPANVLIDRAMVADFGLARPWGDSQERTSSRGVHMLHATLTTTGAVMGTPAYMAPEQHLGEEADAWPTSTASARRSTRACTARDRFEPERWKSSSQRSSLATS
jgi:serine/threonine protein kinase